MDVHVGIHQVIAVSWLISLIIVHFVSAAYGKRIGMKGGTIKDSTINAVDDATKATIARLESEIKALKERA